jgi:heterodisulfide reductase subunit A
VSRKEGRETIVAGAVILATGAMPYDPSSEARLGHTECPDVLTSLEVERMLSSNEQLTVPSTGLVPKDMAIVQCVGSRDERHGAPYCSKACCKYGHKIGRRVRHLYADMSLTFFHMDWRPLEDPLDALGVWAAEDDKVRVVRSRPSEIVPGPRPVVRYTTIGESVAEDAFDLVMLTDGLAPLPDNGELAGAFGIRRDRFGFLVSDHEDTLVAGACRGPMDLRESIEDGIAAAGKAARTVERL